MKSIRVTISGTTPLICNKFTDANAVDASSGASGAIRVKDRGTPQEIAQSKLYIGINGKPMIPQPNVLRSIVDGGKFHKAGKKQITTKTESLLYACTDIEGSEITIDHSQPWKVDTRAVRIPSTGGRILAHRPMFDDWKLTFTIKYDDTFINEKLLRQIVDDAGARIGLGDFRPSCKGPYGKFRVDAWEQE